MDNDPLAYLRAAHAAAVKVAQAAAAETGAPGWRSSEGGLYSDDASRHPGPFLVGGYDYTPPEIAEHVALHDPAAVLRRIARERKLMEQHEPEWSTVEWPDDQNGKGEAQICRSCGNRDIDSWMNWRPAVGEAGVFPPGVKPPYIIAPCDTMHAIAEGWGWTGETP